MSPDAEPVQQSLLSWMFTALGFPYVVLLPLAGFLCFLLALIVVIRGKGPMARRAHTHRSCATTHWSLCVYSRRKSFLLGYCNEHGDT